MFPKSVVNCWETECSHKAADLPLEAYSHYVMKHG